MSCPLIMASRSLRLTYPCGTIGTFVNVVPIAVNSPSPWVSLCGKCSGGKENSAVCVRTLFPVEYDPVGLESEQVTNQLKRNYSESRFGKRYSRRSRVRQYPAPQFGPQTPLVLYRAFGSPTGDGTPRLPGLGAASPSPPERGYVLPPFSRFVVPAMGARCRLPHRAGICPAPLLPDARPPSDLWCISGRGVFPWL